ncbi:MAG: molybdopterin-dependent oxidoreductase Mo/Fe-S-binding subunit [Spirochaetia bacterium]|jgi:putative selenate reductase molybdopterin-binding subunit
MKISFTLNGVCRSVSAEPGESLQVLLQRIGIPSVRSSDDGEGFAGSDTILFDGKAVLAGLMVAGQAEGHAIETVEGLAKGSRLSMLQEAMIEAGVVQSGYNTPAAALLLEDLLRRTKEPTEDDVRDALSGLFSRATGYKQFFLAVTMACTRRSGGVWSAPVAPAFGDGLHVIGKSARKIDGGKLAAGMKAYVEDRVETGSCVLLMLRSPHAHAFIRSIDTARAQALPGVVLVIDHRSCPDVAYGQAGQGFPEPSPYDYRMFSRTVRHVGDRVAAVVAEDEATARRALGLIEVSYDVMPPVLSLEEAMAGSLAPVHADHPGEIVYQLSIGADAGKNLAASASGGTGNVDEGFRMADVVVERTYSTSRVQCTPLEPHVAYTKMDGDRLIVHASTQVPWHLRRILARVLGLPENRIRVIKERVGGGYGSKQDVLMEEVCAYATVRTGRPVLYKYTREEEFIAATTRHPFRIAVKMGAKKDGTLTAIRMSADADTGAYGQHCLTVPMNACSKSLPLFRCPNMAWEVRSWYTNHVPSGAYQGYGAPQGSFAVQMAAAELADALGMDLVSFFDKNHVREGDLLEILKSLGEGRAGAAARVRSCGLDRALAQGRESIGWGASQGCPDPDADVKVGKGAAIIQQGSGLPGLDQACADVKLLSDGTFMVHSGGADLGTGLDTVLAKIVAETLCCEMDTVAVITGDTDTTPFDKGAYASSGTYFTGNASLKAAEALREKMLRVAASMLKEPAEELALERPGKVSGRKGAVDFGAIARHCQGGEGPGELVGHASFTTDDAAFPYAAHFCEVGVNVRTGVVDVRRYHAVHDCGIPINPELALGQVYGAILKSIGHALYEEMIFDEQGRCLTKGLAEYGAPMIQELPRELDVKFVATDDPFGPYGAKSVAEISVNGAAPAIAVAVHNATGVWIRDWPITPEKILTALGRLS